MDIRLHFSGFWSGFDKTDNFWIWILKQRHNVILDDITPNLVISMQLKKPIPNVFTLYYSNEPFFPNLTDLSNIADFFLSNFFIDLPNHKRFPSYYMYLCEFIRLGLIPDLSFFNEKNRIIPEKSDFCVFVSKSLNGKRGRFFEKLNKYKKIDTNVHPYNSIHIPYDSSQFNSSIPKMNFIKKYKFNIAFENNWRGHHPCFPNAVVEQGELLDMGGFISEKLIEPLLSGVLPLYWGSSMVSEEFNNKTYLNYYDFNNEDDFIDKIIELDNNDELYNYYFKESIVSKDNNVFNLEKILDIFDDILNKI